MYIEELKLVNIRTFANDVVRFVHPDQDFGPRGQNGDASRSGLTPEPSLPNVNLLLGDNGSGKSTILRTVAMAVLGPAFESSRLPTSGMIRKAAGSDGVPQKMRGATANFHLWLHEQDGFPFAKPDWVASGFKLERQGELESFRDFFVRKRRILFLGLCFRIPKPGLLRRRLRRNPSRGSR